MDFNGWKNRATWNVALWINNDEALYNAAKDFMAGYTGKNSYWDFAKYLNSVGYFKTPDGISFMDSELSINELNELMQEF